MPSRRFHPLFAGLILGAGLLCNDPARAQEEGNRIMFVTPTEASSPCIGDATRPLCAAETTMACDSNARGAAECKRVDPAGPERTAERRMEYFITRMLFVSRRLAAKMERQFFYNGPFVSTAGEFILLANWRSCPLTQTSCAGGPWREGFVAMGYSPRHRAWIVSNMGLAGKYLPPNWFDE